MSNWEKQILHQWSLNDIEIGHVVSRFKGNNSHSAGSAGDLVRLHFGLAGDYSFTYRELGKSFDLAGGHHNIMYSAGIHLEIRNKSQVIETLGISFRKNRFIELMAGATPQIDSFIKKLQEGHHTILSDHWGTITIEIQKTIGSILGNPFQGKLSELFLMSKILELLILCLENYQMVNKKQYQFIKNIADKEKIIAARDILSNHLDDPLRLSDLSRKVGINEFKLKHGFKEFFGSTPFEYLTQMRLERARYFLRHTDMTIDAIALKLGYSSTPHFHQQFKRIFGTTPNSVRKNP